MNHLIPSRPDDLSVEFLAELVAEAHPGLALSDVKVIGISRFGEVNVSTSARVSMEFEYAGGSEQLTRRVIAKMSMGEDVSSDVVHSQLFGFYENEVRFYQQARPNVVIETPAFIGARVERQSERYVLLMSDMKAAGAHFPSMDDDIGLDYVQRGIESYAKLHAAYWQDPRLGTDFSWVSTHTSGIVEDVTRGLIFDSVRNVLKTDKYRREMLQRMRTTEPELFSGMCAVKAHFSELPQTLLHGDAHLGNTYQLPDGTVGVYDWQAFSRGFCMHDVSYFIITSLSVDLRRAHERELLALYRENLLTNGVKNVPPLDFLWECYRQMALWSFCPAWLCAPVDNYGWDLTSLALVRTSTAFEDLETMKAVRALL